jgi:hypothetical protein
MSFAPVTVGGPSDTFELSLTVGAHQVALPPLPVAGALSGLAVTVDDDFVSPGPLVTTWTPPGGAGRVGTHIRINHHRKGPTFTECEVPAADAVFEASEPMIDPLAVVTGLEFQGVWHTEGAAVDLPEGCVDVTLGTSVFVSPGY